MHFGANMREKPGACDEIRSFEGCSSPADFWIRVARMFWIFFRLAFALIATCCD
jgi:hypothetical protein